MYEFFDHTADLGIRVRATSLEELFVESAHAITAAIVEDPASIQASQAELITLSGADRTYLLFDWLNELLFRFEARRMLFRQFEVTLLPEGLTATITGEPYHPQRHPLQHEVKAITYHGLSLTEEAGQFQAELIVDI